SSVVAATMVAEVRVSAAGAIVTSAATMESSRRATAESAATAAVKSSATMTTMLGKSSPWQPDKRANADDGEQSSQHSMLHHVRNKNATQVVRVSAIRNAGHCHSC